MRIPFPAVLLLWLAACGNPLPGAEQSATASPSDLRSASGQAAAADARGEAVKPPFEVSGELEGLLLTWFDAEGLHAAQRRSDIPEAHRAQVRVQSLGVAPEQRLDPDFLYLADLRKAGADGSYPVRKVRRGDFDAQVDRARPLPAPDQAAPPGAVGEGAVVLYKASWCGACRAAASYMRSRQVDFVEKDIERDALARSEMQQKAKAAGKTPRGVPVIDFRGEILLGFDKARLSRLIDASKGG
ncbi:MAG: hypothetical protein OEZ06_27020 [Myxococcales bacterium]|nr:hypothetical protein [Myxococcales bacterium]